MCPTNHVLNVADVAVAAGSGGHNPGLDRPDPVAAEVPDNRHIRRHVGQHSANLFQVLLRLLSLRRGFYTVLPHTLAKPGMSPNR